MLKVAHLGGKSETFMMAGSAEWVLAVEEGATVFQSLFAVLFYIILPYEY